MSDTNLGSYCLPALRGFPSPAQLDSKPISSSPPYSDLNLQAPTNTPSCLQFCSVYGKLLKWWYSEVVGYEHGRCQLKGPVEFLVWATPCCGCSCAVENSNSLKTGTLFWTFIHQVTDACLILSSLLVTLVSAVVSTFVSVTKKSMIKLPHT